MWCARAGWRRCWRCIKAVAAPRNSGPKRKKNCARGCAAGAGRLKDAQQWLAARHRVEMGLGGVRSWIKKAGAVWRVPRKTHARQNPAQVEEFRRTLARRLCQLELPKERVVRVWVADFPPLRAHPHGAAQLGAAARAHAGAAS